MGRVDDLLIDKKITYATNFISVEAFYLPPTVNHIDNYAFRNCKSLIFLYVPESIDHIGHYTICECDTRLLTTDNYNNDEVNQ